jgi:hypothetical protein
MAGPGRRRELLLLPLAVLLLAVATVPLVLHLERREARGHVEREDAALAAARAVARAERAFHARHGRYAWLEDVRDAGLLAGLTTVDGPQGLQAESGDYRLDVLLPSAQPVAGEIAIAPRAAGPADPTLMAKHFVVIARPRRPGVDGFRIWYLDEEDRVFVSEGVVDPEGLRQNPLPLFRVTTTKKPADPGLIWRNPLAVEKD